MRILFMGTPDFAAASLKELLDQNYEIIGVFSQPDRPSGRGMDVVYSPVKQLALEYGIPVYQPEKMKDGTALEIVKSLSPDILVVVAYGRILPDEILKEAPLGAINVHASLLPKYRGSAPIQWAVLNGDKTTGVSTMYLASEMDTGDVIYQEETEIGEFETSEELFERLKHIGAKLLVRTLCDIENGTAPRIPQNHSQASYVKMLDKSFCPINFNQSPRQVIKWICGLQSWPVATAVIGGQTLKIYAAEYTDTRTELAPGSIVSTDCGGIEIACAGGETIRITELQAPGKKRMKAVDYLRGHKL